MWVFGGSEGLGDPWALWRVVGRGLGVMLSLLRGEPGWGLWIWEGFLGGIFWGGGWGRSGGTPGKLRTRSRPRPSPGSPAHHRETPPHGRSPALDRDVTRGPRPHVGAHAQPRPGYVTEKGVTATPIGRAAQPGPPPIG